MCFAATLTLICWRHHTLTLPAPPPPPGQSALPLLSDPVRMSGTRIVFLDIRMPGMSGIELMQALPCKPSCPVVSVTGSVEPDAVEEMK